MEISIFLEQRLVNVENKDEINLAMYNNSLKNFNLKYSSEELKKIKNNFDELINQLKEKNLIFICEIYTDENNIKSIVDVFDDIQINNKKLNNTILNLKNKNEELMKEIKENDKKITDLRKNTVQLRKMIEVFLTKNLKRKINIMGDEYLFAK
jgi:predicted  nucleic acid-binding Zn-ribbon protein